jgi:tRNA (guanine37-N1)-methyltransferase
MNLCIVLSVVGITLCCHEIFSPGKQTLIPAMGLKEQLHTVIPSDRIGFLSDHFDVIGEIAVLHLPPELESCRAVIADTILAHNHRIKTVLNKITRLDGSSRTAHYEILAGTDTITTHREYGFLYRLDLNTVFFNPKLASERKRVTDQVQPGERVYVPFCGAGPFAVPAAARGGDVVAVEQNPHACQWFRENVRQNALDDRIVLVQGDAFDLTILPITKFDRIIIPTPYGMDRILDVLMPLIGPGGMIHFYTFKNRTQSEHLEKLYNQNGFTVVMRHRCGNVAPSVSRWVFDLVKD